MDLDLVLLVVLIVVLIFAAPAILCILNLCKFGKHVCCAGGSVCMCIHGCVASFFCSKDIIEINDDSSQLLV